MLARHLWCLIYLGELPRIAGICEGIGIGVFTASFVIRCTCRYSWLPDSTQAGITADASGRNYAAVFDAFAEQQHSSR